MTRFLLGMLIAVFAAPAYPGQSVEFAAPASARRYEPVEFTIRVEEPTFKNPFVDARITGRFSVPPAENSQRVVHGYADSQDGRLFKLRFCPDRVGTWSYELHVQGPDLDRSFTGRLRCEPSDRDGPVVVDPKHPKHFVYAGSGKPFFHLGYTAYHLLDPSNDEAQIDALIDYCAREGFNKIRFLLTGYPRDTTTASEQPGEYGVNEPMKLPNYGARPGEVNPLPAWLGKPHHYDFTRFNVDHWRRAEGAVGRMADKGIVATCIVTIEKQNLPKEYGRLTEDEYRLYRYAIARLAGFDNVWWDLGNEHNEYRNVEWGHTMGAFVRREDPYGRLTSVHAYREFFYSNADWADFIITQQYGRPREVYDWVLKYAKVPKPYINEEYGYEGERAKPGHNQNTDLTRRGHWSVAMAGGYATYGDSSGGVAWFYMGEPGPGKAARQLKHLRSFFEALPFREMSVDGSITSRGFALVAQDCAVVYLPEGGETVLSIPDATDKKWSARWFDPRTGAWRGGPAISSVKTTIQAPGRTDWALLLKAE